MIITFSKLNPPKGDYRSDNVIFCYCNGSHLRNKYQCLILSPGESTDMLMNSMYMMWNHFVALVLDPPKTYLIVKGVIWLLQI